MSIHNLLENIIYGKIKLCCLCLQPTEVDAVLVQDHIVYENEEKIYSDDVVDILDLILDREIMDNLLPYDVMCRVCRKKAIEAYKFVKLCKETRRSVAYAISAISNNLHSLDQAVSSKTVFVHINPIDLSSTAYNTKQALTTKKKALKRFKILVDKKDEHGLLEENFDTVNYFSPTQYDIDINICIDKVGNKVQEKKRRIKQHKSNSSIPLSEMRVDETDYKCKICLKKYPSSQHLRQHYLRVHTPKNYKCTKCPRCYSTGSLLKQHKYDSHTPVICTECGKTYQNRHSLKMHEMGHSTKITCTNCGRAYKHLKTFKAHIAQNICKQKERRSNSEAKYTCDHCGKRYTHKGTLRVHIQFEHGNGKAHICPWCSKKFCAQSRLKAHIVKHTQEKRFCCELCGGKFVTKESLLYHTRIHTGDKPYQCHLCESRFLSSSRRAEHIRRLHKTASLECEICHSKFKGRSSLVKHVKRHFNPKNNPNCSNETNTIEIKD